MSSRPLPHLRRDRGKAALSLCPSELQTISDCLACETWVGHSAATSISSPMHETTRTAMPGTWGRGHCEWCGFRMLFLSSCQHNSLSRWNFKVACSIKCLPRQMLWALVPRMKALTGRAFHVQKNASWGQEFQVQRYLQL